MGYRFRVRVGHRHRAVDPTGIRLAERLRDEAVEQALVRGKCRSRIGSGSGLGVACATKW